MLLIKVSALKWLRELYGQCDARSHQEYPMFPTSRIPGVFPFLNIIKDFNTCSTLAMVSSSCFFSFVVAGAASIAISSASDITTFPVEYDVLTVTCELQVEALAGPVSSAGLPQVNELFQAFISTFNDDVKSGNLTVVDHNKRIDSFVTAVSAFVPNFKNESENAIAGTPIDFFTFRAGAHAASWDVLYDAAAAVAAETGTAEITPLLASVDSYMVQNIGTASPQELQLKSDDFFENAEAVKPGFRDLVYKIISHLYDEIWKTVMTDTSTLLDGSEAGSGTGSASEESEASEDSKSGSSSGQAVGVWDEDDSTGTQQRTTHSPPASKPHVDQSNPPMPSQSASNAHAVAISTVVVALVSFALHM